MHVDSRTAMEKMSVKLVRRPSGFDFSVKGGAEHGVPIIVSAVEKGGAADGYLEENDEIQAVNNQSLNGFTHQQAVQVLRTAGSEVCLLIIRHKEVTSSLKNETERTEMMEKFATMREKIRSQTSRTVSSDNMKHAPPARPFPKELQSRLVAHQQRNHVEAKQQEPIPQILHQNFSSKKDKAIPVLPQGWSLKEDEKTKRQYYENHFTQISTWTDPISLPKMPSLQECDWRGLLPRWEECRDEFGCIYYVNHDNKTTHWNSPRDTRQLELVRGLVTDINDQRKKLRLKEVELGRKRSALLEKNSELKTWSQKRTHAMESMSGNEVVSEQIGNIEQEMATVVEGIMKMNEVIETLDSELTTLRNHLRNVEKAASVSFHEVSELENGQAETAMILAEQLVQSYQQSEAAQRQQLVLIHKLESLRKVGAVIQSGTAAFTPELSLNYLLQLPGRKSSDETNVDGLHLLPDERTVKTNIEMRVDRLLLDKCSCRYQSVCQRLETMFDRVESDVTAWDDVIDELSELEILDVHQTWIQLTFKDKVGKLLSGEY